MSSGSGGSIRASIGASTTGTGTSGTSSSGGAVRASSGDDKS